MPPPELPHMPYTAVRRRPARALAARLVAALTVAGAGACGGRTLDPIADPGTRAEAVVVREAARPITGAAGDYDPILALVDAGTRLVLVGDATHGTHEFYAERARLTQRLVTDRGFTAVAIESDWADAARVNAYVRGVGTDRSAEEALSAFRDFPDWMWRNVEMRDFVQWLRTHNAARPPAQRVGVYGIDVQDLFGPIAPVLAHLDATDPAAAARVRSHYASSRPTAPPPNDTAWRCVAARRARRARAPRSRRWSASPGRARPIPRPRRRSSGRCAPRTRWRARRRTFAPPISARPTRGTCATRSWTARSTPWSSTSARRPAPPPVPRCGRTTRTSATRVTRRWAPRAS
jgi:hypothetical protein